MVSNYEEPPAVVARNSFPFTDPSVPSRACCCPARPVMRVIMPPTPDRPRPVDLWLCAHHYRASVTALAAAGATVSVLVLAAPQPPAEHPAGRGLARPRYGGY